MLLKLVSIIFIINGYDYGGDMSVASGYDGDDIDDADGGYDDADGDYDDADGDYDDAGDDYDDHDYDDGTPNFGGN